MSASAAVPASTKAHHKLGEEYLRVGRLAEAVEALRAAVRLSGESSETLAGLVQRGDAIRDLTQCLFPRGLRQVAGGLPPQRLTQTLAQALGLTRELAQGLGLGLARLRARLGAT